MGQMQRSWLHTPCAVLQLQTRIDTYGANQHGDSKTSIIVREHHPLLTNTILLPEAKTHAIPTASTSSRTQRTRSQPQQSPTLLNSKPPVEIYTVYTHDDKHFFLKIKQQLGILDKQGKPISCHEDEIIYSTDWQKHDYLATANLILLLISSTFLDSDFCYCKQMYFAVERHRTNNLCYVIPIILRPVSQTLLEGTPFSTVTFLPTNGKSIDEWSNSSKAYVNIIDYLIKKMESMSYYL